MHLVAGFASLLLAQLLISLRRVVRIAALDRAAVGLCCSAFLAGAGLDDAAIDMLRAMGPAGRRVLEDKANAPGSAGTIPRHILDLLNVRVRHDG
jgi:hypothetical protein